MGILKALAGSTQGVLADQWKEFFYCEAMPSEIIGMRGRKRVSDRSANTKSDDNVITDGSLIVVADGQIAIAVEQGKAFACWTTPGEHVFHSAASSSVFEGGGLQGVFHQIGQRVAFGGDVPLTQRIYYFSCIESGAQSFQTAAPIPFRVKDPNVGLDMTAGIHCSGSFSYRLKDPILFYNTVCGNFADTYPRRRLAQQLQSEFLTTLQAAIGQLADWGMRASELPGQTEALYDLLKASWRDQRGLELVSIGISISVNEEDFHQIKQMQHHGALRDPGMAAAALVGAQSSAMRSAASNQAGMSGFWGTLNVMKADDLVGQMTKRPQTWTCSCGMQNNGNFCENCGKKRPE